MTNLVEDNMEHEVHKSLGIHLTNEETIWRKTKQPILPAYDVNENVNNGNDYNIYPKHRLPCNTIFSGYEKLITWIVEEKNVLIDGYVGIFWEDIKKSILEKLCECGYTVNIFWMADYQKSSHEINQLVKPFLGAHNTVWGTKTSLQLSAIFHTEKLHDIQPSINADINIVIGVGAALVHWQAALMYIDLPKNELQYRMRAGVITNLGNNVVEEPSTMYKRFYFVDWVMLNNHKLAIVNKIKVIADAQWKETINWMYGEHFFEGLSQLSKSSFRVRPWFEAGAWGGQWMKQHLAGINKEEKNYAWSFELIVPENGLVFESSGHLLEVSFDFLMFKEYKAVLGKHAEQFGYEFPIRFDFLDTVEGGNLSIQCHPRLDYIRNVFGENITQDETYYILDCKENANVFLGFQDDIQPSAFRQALEHSQLYHKEIDITKYVQSHIAKKHQLFLIPNGTIHSAGAGNLVLEISATPYIFTFKMYDWLRPDLNGLPRPINIDHAFNNLDFERKGKRVQEELIATPIVIESSVHYEVVHLPTHAAHFYDIHSIAFDDSITIENDNTCHIMMLVEGRSITVTTNNNSNEFNYAETFVIPAMAGNYTLTNKSNCRARVIKAFLK